VLAIVFNCRTKYFKRKQHALLNPNTRFAKKAPFDFVLENKNLKALQYEDIEIKLTNQRKNLAQRSVYL
jgi:hypothetical protein